MREYARVSPKFWTGSTGRQIRELGAECQVVALYLLTSPHSNMIGLYYLPVAFIAHETGLSVARSEVAMAKLITAGFCAYDTDAEVVWVHEMARYQIGELSRNHKQAIGAAALYEAAPECVHLAAFFVRYNGYLPLEKQRGVVARPIDGLSVTNTVPAEATDSLSIAYRSPIDAPPKPIDLERRARSDEQGATSKSDEQGTKALSSKLDDSPPTPTGEVLAVFAHYRTHHGRAHPSPKPGGKEWRAIKARLAEGYPVDELKLAIDGCHKTPWNCGENPGGKTYQSLELIMRSGDHVARFAETARQYANGPPPVLTEQSRRNLRAAEAWVQRKEAQDAGG